MKLSGKLLVLTSLSIILNFDLFSQQISVKGKVLDDSGETIPFANILIKNSQKGTTSDINGEFALEVLPTDVLVASFVGYEPLEITVGNQSYIQFILSLDVNALEEVVVIGYGSVKKSDLTGSVSVLDPKEISKFPVANLGSALQGRLSGVQVVNASEPGMNPQILVRGFGTIFGDPNPLVVIDGLQTGVGALANLDPSAIESVQVLKDASAAAIYGSRAANGVMIITTKRGRAESFEINYTSEIGVQTVANRFDLMNTKEYADYTTKLYVNSSTSLVPRNPPFWTEDPNVLATNTDWQDVMFQRAMVQNHNLNFSGGGKTNTYYLGFGYLKQDGVLPKTSFERFNLQINTQINKSKFKIGESINLYHRFKPQNEMTSNASRLYMVAPQIPVYDPSNLNGLGSPLPTVTGGNNLANPLAYNFRAIETRTMGMLGNVFAEYEILEGLSIRGDINVDASFSSFERYRSPLDQSQASITRNDTEILLRNFINTSLNSETLLKYNRTFGEHSLNILAGYTIIRTVTNGVIASADNLEPDTRVPQTGQNQQGSAEYTESRLLSQLGRINYNYKGKYLVTASIRRDGSSNFGRNNRWGVFPSFSLGWQLGEEAFMSGLPFVSQLKIRGGYGELGRTLGNFIATLNSEIRYPWSSGAIAGVGPLTVPNENLRWETVKQVNIGFDIGLFSNMIKFTADFYQRLSDDMIIRIPVPQYTGIVQQPWFNFGSMINRGVEFEFAYSKVVSKVFDHQVKFNITFNQNEVIKLDNVQDILLANGTITTIGEPVAVHYGWLTEGINPANGTMNFLDINKDGQVNGADRVVLGSPHPDAFFGITYAAFFKSFDFNIFLQGVVGNEIMNESLQQLGSTHQDRNRLKSVLIDAWDRNSNPNGTIPIISLRNDNDNDRISGRFIEKGDYLRIRNVQLGYTLPTTLFNNTFKKLRCYVNVVNLLTFTGYSGLDPDLNNNGDVFSLGRDTFRYPPLRSFNLGFQASF